MAHRVKTSTVATYGGRRHMESTRLSIPYRGTREGEVFERETPYPTPGISTHTTSIIIPSSGPLRKEVIDSRHAGHGDERVETGMAA